MPKLTPKTTLNDRLLNSTTVLRDIPRTKVKSEREALVIQIWNSITKPSRKFETDEEQLAYYQGVDDERECQRIYDSKLRDAGIR